MPEWHGPGGWYNPLVLLAFLIGLTLLLLLAWAFAPRGVWWANDLTRLKPGAGRHAEWLAPPDVVRAVRRDYLSAQAWLAECAAEWGLVARELERFTAGDFLKRQRHALALLAQVRGPRLAAVLETDHHVTVRRFSADGLRCLVIDRQADRRMRTHRYWDGRPVIAQRLPNATLVYGMLYDLRDRRWKIERLVQALPPAPDGPVRITVAAELPTPAGRDY